MGVVGHLVKAMEQSGLSESQARENFWILDVDGLITEKRMEALPDFVKPYARKETAHEGMSLLSTISEFKPTILIGLSTVGGLFQEEHLKEMSRHHERPLVMPLSNPTSRYDRAA